MEELWQSHLFASLVLGDETPSYTAVYTLPHECETYVMPVVRGWDEDDRIEFTVNVWEVRGKPATPTWMVDATPRDKVAAALLVLVEK